MNPGVVSLRCPACARPFLSLPLQPGSPVACPHCGRKGAAASYGAAGGTLGEAMVHSIRQRVEQPPILQPRPTAVTTASWPAAPPLFAGPVRQPPLSAAEPQWPFISPDADPPSPFSDLNLDRVTGTGEGYPGAGSREWAPEPSERNVPLGIFLLVIILAGLWMLWLNLQPPMSAEIPAVSAPEARFEPVPQTPTETVVETIRRVDFGP